MELSERGIKARGSVRANRKGMPSNFPSDKEMKRGDIASFSADGIACVKWMDNRAVIPSYRRSEMFLYSADALERKKKWNSIVS